MKQVPWWQEFPAAVTVCDADGVILAMNERAAEVFAGDGGRRLIGSSLLDCHPEPARAKLQAMLASGRANVYTIESGGVRRFIYQAPWFRNGRYTGFVELELDIPADLPHFQRGQTTAS
jgi:PAS domain-containing protein